MRLLIAIAALLSGAALACGGGDDGTTVTVVAKDVLFMPAELTVPAGEEITLELKNEDDEEHDLVVEGIEATVSAGHDDGGHGAEVAVHVEGGETDSVTFTTHKAGTYTFYCTIKGHREAGMEGTIEVAS